MLPETFSRLCLNKYLFQCYLYLFIFNKSDTFNGTIKSWSKRAEKHKWRNCWDSLKNIQIMWIIHGTKKLWIELKTCIIAKSHSSRNQSEKMPSIQGLRSAQRWNQNTKSLTVTTLVHSLPACSSNLCLCFAERVAGKSKMALQQHKPKYQRLTDSARTMMDFLKAEHSEVLWLLTVFPEWIEIWCY